MVYCDNTLDNLLAYRSIIAMGFHLEYLLVTITIIMMNH